MAKKINIDDEIIEIKQAESKRKVNIHSLNVRKEPSTDAEIVKVIRRGDAVKVEEDLGEWLKIKGGFVMSQYID